MAEIVALRVEKTINELNLLVEYGLFTEPEAKEILAKRQNFEYNLRRKTRTKLDYLKYIRFEVNLLEALDKYKKRIVQEYWKNKEANTLEELERRIILLQAKKLNDVIRARCAHISSLFRKLTTSFQFDKNLWLAYIDFARSRNWNTRVTALYWRLLRVCGNCEDIWIAAASHEVKINKAFDVARGLYLRALRHHPNSVQIWIEYFIMEVKFAEIVDRRARIVFKVSEESKEKKDEEVNIWVDDECELKQTIDEDKIEEEKNLADEEKEEAVPNVKPVDQDDQIISGHLPKIIFNNALKALKSGREISLFVTKILIYILSSHEQTKVIMSLKDYICTDLKTRHSDGELTISKELVSCCDKLEDLKEYLFKLNADETNPQKKLRSTNPSKLEILYECYKSNGIGKTRDLFIEYEKSIRNQTLSLYVGMIQVEIWQSQKDKSKKQLNMVRAIYEKALNKFGKDKAKLWYEYLYFEHAHAKSLEDFDRINQIYSKAQSTLNPSKVDRVIERYTMLQVKTSKTDLEYSDYSDIDD